MKSNIIEDLTAAEMAIAERTAGISITSLEDENAPKVNILGALAWVHAKRDEPTLTFKAFMEGRKFTELAEYLGLGDDEDEGGDE